ncbi:MAG: ABC transporter permease [Promethearchaeota archaeon]
MFRLRSLKRYSRQVLALIEKEIFMELRFKSKLITRYLNPIIQLLILVFIFRTIFSSRAGLSIGYWNQSNYILFLLIAFILQFSRSITLSYESIFRREKFRKTLSAIMVAPVNRFTILVGVLISEFLLNSVPIIIFFIIALVLFPISIYYIILILVIYFLIILILASIGLLISIFTISNEEYVPFIKLFLGLNFLFSCSNYPKEIFPGIVQYIIIINPFYYIFDLLRLTWYMGYNFEEAISYISYIHIIIIILMAILSPIISIYCFNKVFKKYGITGF